jgi:hypothetical protein
LLDAADAGELQTADSVAEHAVRLLESPRAKDGLGNFLREKFELYKVPQVTKDAKVFPSFSRNLVAAMKRESELLLDDLFFARDADALDVLDARTTFINDELAALYGIEGITGSEFRAVELPATSERLGILGHAAFLAAKAHTTSTSPTLRGKFVRERILCGSMQAPPSNVDTSLPEDPVGSLTVREKLDRHRTDPTCAGCHALMDPIGVSFERFDALGAIRDRDAGQVIDTRGDLDGKAYESTPELLALLRADPAVADCFVRDLYRYATAHRELKTEEPLLEALATAFNRDGRVLRDLIVKLVSSDGFRFASEQ